jgi:hypothetical protein
MARSEMLPKKPTIVNSVYLSISTFIAPGAVALHMPLVDIPANPAIIPDGDFYICFYDRGGVAVLTEVDKTTGKSYYYLRDTQELVPASIPDEYGGMATTVNWIIRAIGE